MRWGRSGSRPDQVGRDAPLATSPSARAPRLADAARGSGKERPGLALGSFNQLDLPHLVYQGDEWRLVPNTKSPHSIKCTSEYLSVLGSPEFAWHKKKRFHVMPHNRGTRDCMSTDPIVLRKNDVTASAAFRKPEFVRCIVWKQVGVNRDCCAGSPKNGGYVYFSEASIYEEDQPRKMLLTPTLAADGFVDLAKVSTVVPS